MKVAILIFFCISMSGCGRSSSDGPAAESRGTDTINSDLDVTDNALRAEKSHAKGRCDLAIVSRTESRINLLRDEDIFEFLYTFSDDCKSDFEYVEFSNEVLFKVLLKYPEMVSESLNKDSLDRNLIFQNLSSPAQSYDKVAIKDAIKMLDISDSLRSVIVDGINNSK